MGVGISGCFGVFDVLEILFIFGMFFILIIGLIVGGDIVLCNLVENVEDNIIWGWEELIEYNINDKDMVIGIVVLGIIFYVIGVMYVVCEYGILIGCIISNLNFLMVVEVDIFIEMIVGFEYVMGSLCMKLGMG